MDLNLLPLARQNGQDLIDLPGVLIAAQPRRTARGRQPDRLILYFSTEGNAPLAADQQDQLLNRLAQTYYNTPGSVTAAMRTIAENTNQFLLDRNLRAASSGRQSAGLLAIITVRENRLYLAQCGPLQAFLLNASGVEVFADPQSARRGLGLGKVTPIHYAQGEFTPNDSLIVTAVPPAAWRPETLAGLHGQGPEILRRRLLALSGADLQAVLLQARPGSGKSYLLKPRPAASVDIAPEELAVETQAPAVETAAETELPEALPGMPAAPHLTVPEVVEAASPPAPIELPAKVTEAGFQESVSAPAAMPAYPDEPAQAPAAAPSRRERRSARPSGEGRPARAPFPLRGALDAMANAFSATMTHFAGSLGTFVRRMLPGEGLFTLPASIMFTTAVAVPLVVVAVASVVYFQRGRAAEFQSAYGKAVQAANFAQAQSDPQTQRTAWIAVQSYLDEAEKYGASEEVKTLRSQAQLASDTLNQVQRLDYQPAISGGLQGGAKIVKMIATGGDLYLLDASSGTAWRAFSTGVGYEIDNTFQCGPGFPSSGAIQPLVDIAAIPQSEGTRISLVGIDGEGNALQCQTGEPPLYIALPTPYTGWGKPQAIRYDQGEMYILDPAKNAVWIYNEQFSDQARPFFTGDPPEMDGIVDIAIQKGDLYLLYSNSKMRLCSFTGMTVAPTQCDDLPSADSRPGLDGRVYAPETPYLQMIATPSPDPSIYVLEPAGQALHHFSLRFTFQRQLRPVKALATAAAGSMAPATAFTLTPDKRVVLLAVGGEVFYAGIP